MILFLYAFYKSCELDQQFSDPTFCIRAILSICHLCVNFRFPLEKTYCKANKSSTCYITFFDVRVSGILCHQRKYRQNIIFLLVQNT